MLVRTIALTTALLWMVSAIAGRTYTVRTGDTLLKIASRLGVDATSLKKLNGITNTATLKPGKVLKVPEVKKPVASSKASAIKITADNVSVRKTPSTSAPKVATVSKGRTAVIVGRTTEWVKVKFAGGTVGYVRRDLITPIYGNAATKAVASSKPKKPVIQATAVKIAKPAVIVRKSPSTSAAKVVTVQQGKVATILGRTPEWLKVKFSGGTVGYVRRDMITPVYGKPSSKPAYAASGEKINYIHTSLVKINTDNVTIRKSPKTSGSKITMVDKGTVATIVGRSGAWYKLKFKHGTVGYVRGDLVNSYSRTMPGSRNPAGPRDTRVIASNYKGDPNDLKLVASAKACLGIDYVYGGESTRGFDCSGFVWWLYKNQEGVNLPRTAASMSGLGNVVSSKESLRPGDIVLFRTRGSSRINHAGMYIGGGKFIHASSGKDEVRIDSLYGGYYDSRYAGGRRVKSDLKTVGGGTKSSTKAKSAKSASAKKSESSKKKGKKPKTVE